jgi:hypothetical protein
MKRMLKVLCVPSPSMSACRVSPSLTRSTYAYQNLHLGPPLRQRPLFGAAAAEPAHAVAASTAARNMRASRFTRARDHIGIPARDPKVRAPR